MKEELIAKNNIILKIESGSFLYGTNTETSDRDYVGICIPPEEYVIGLFNFEQYQENTKNSSIQRRNNKDDKDYTIYSLKKYVELAKNNNPNILEILYVPQSNIQYINQLGTELLDNASLFPSQKALFTFLGYAHSQKMKLTTKRSRLQALRSALETLENIKNTGYTTLPNKLEIIDPARVSNIQLWKTYEKNSNICDVEKDIDKMISEYGSRTEYIKKHGYDTKFSSHLIRLLLEGKELLSTGKLTFPIKQRQLILDVKNGNFTLDDILSLSTELEFEVQKASDSTCLPKVNDIKKISDLLISLTKEHWNASLLKI